LPNLNREAGQVPAGKGGEKAEESRETGNETINETICETIKSRPGITRAELISLVGRSRATVARAVAELIGSGVIERRVSKKTGGYFAKDE
jgi:predicted HTH transcriptional regulator